MSSKRRRSGWWWKLRDRYRLVVMNDDTLEEETSFRLSRLNIYLLLSTVFVLMFILALVLVLFTPLKEYILGYDKIALKEELLKVRMKVDSLERDLQAKNKYILNLKDIMRGEVDTSFKKPPTQNYKPDSLTLNKSHSAEDSLLRAEVEQKEQYYLTKDQRSDKNQLLFDDHFFTPIQGTVTNGFSKEDEHWGVDVVAPKNTAVKAVRDGNVVFADWTSQAGKVIAIQHTNNMISFYKHNSELLKKSGSFVKAGDVVAIIGNTGEFTTGTHLHFELWHEGQPVDPQQYIFFE